MDASTPKSQGFSSSHIAGKLENQPLFLSAAIGHGGTLFLVIGYWLLVLGRLATINQ